MAKSLYLEGVDGTGKSTLIDLLKKYLEENGETVLTLREPGGSPYYQAIRDHIHFSDHERSALSDALTCAGGIAENINLTKKALNAGSWVITDRCYISNAVYQVANGLDQSLADHINSLALQGFTYDIKILLTAPLEVAGKRLSGLERKRDYWELKGNDYFKRVQKLYDQYVDLEDMVIIDATKNIDTVLASIIKLTGV